VSGGFLISLLLCALVLCTTKYLKIGDKLPLTLADMRITEDIGIGDLSRKFDGRFAPANGQKFFLVHKRTEGSKTYRLKCVGTQSHAVGKLRFYVVLSIYDETNIECDAVGSGSAEIFKSEFRLRQFIKIPQNGIVNAASL
jgi:hypothetical protein